MKYIFTLILFSSLSFNLNAQESDFIQGTWLFSEVLNEEIDENSLNYLNSQVLNKWVFIFKEDGTFESPSVGGLSGRTWKFNVETKIITISDTEGNSREFKVIESNKDELSLNLGLGKFRLKRVM